MAPQEVLIFRARPTSSASSCSLPSAGYTDIDTFVLRTGLMTEDVVPGMEASPDSRRTALEPGGLCNAVIVARKDAPFLNRWLATYESFDSSVWAGHSVAKPWELALLYPRELTVLGTRAMFWPLWRGEDIDMVHVPSKADGSGWEFFKSGQLTLVLTGKGESGFTRMVRAFVGPEDLKVEKWLSEAQGP
ncbi:glycosyltransferase family 32 protein [Calocera viscosa TUFC12733]|uniref:Glycosyltransferase family 32 protein n=1 Tax=Calocera viscosa (strain TUFC12733) TaxID=1330018 RepID=A0A167KD99_CALVF|nr:glycosyltransferase family 32 protein [Calocera viscosa TUFC12733]